jgi:hypothetical protein
MRRVCLSLSLAGLLCVGLVGCSGGAGKDPVAEAVGDQYTVSEAAKAGSEGVAQFEEEQRKQQEEADKKARGGR